MSHYQVLMQELAQHGRVTYRELVERYGARGYNYNGFIVAARKARLRGEVIGPRTNGGSIALAGVCPCCGRKL